MADYISREAAFKEFSDFVRASNNSDFAAPPTWNDAVSLIGSLPAADVVERKGGEWIKNMFNAGWHCSVCKTDDFYAYSWNSEKGESEIQDNFCPNCGADMRPEPPKEVHDERTD